jgi:hypothetical protein
MEYNKSLLCQRVDGHNTIIPEELSSSFPAFSSDLFSLPMTLTQHLINSLQDLKNQYTNNPKINPYHEIPYGDYHPTFVSHDYYFLPIILNLIFMITNLENQFIHDYLVEESYHIERGEVIHLDRPLVYGKIGNTKETESKGTKEKSGGADEKTAAAAVVVENGSNNNEEEENEAERIFQAEKKRREDKNQLKKIEKNFLQIYSLLESFSLLLEKDEAPTHENSKIDHFLTDIPEFSISKEIIKNIQQFLAFHNLSKPSTNLLLVNHTPPPTAPSSPEKGNLVNKTMMNQPPVTNHSHGATSFNAHNPLLSAALPENPLTLESVNLLEHHNVQLDPFTGKLIPKEPLGGAPNTAENNNNASTPPTSSKPGSKPNSRAGGLPPKGPNNNLLKKTVTKSAPGTATTATAESKNNANPLLLNPSSSYNSDLYIPMVKDRLSVFSELIISIDNFGRDEISAWITYTLTNISGVSIGYLGQTVLDGTEIFHFLEKKNQQTSSGSSKRQQENKEEPIKRTTSGSPTAAAHDHHNSSAFPFPAGNNNEEAFLTEVRNRLIEIETKLSLTPMLFYDYNIDLMANPNALSTSVAGAAKDQTANYHLTEDFQFNCFRVIILILLIKVSVQLLMKQEVNSYLSTLEKLSKVLYTKYRCFSVEVVVYYAIAMKFRVEYEEWLIPPNEFNALPIHYQPQGSAAVTHLITPGEYLNNLVFNLLPWCKKYYELTREANNLFFMKDSLKKLMNLYVLIAQLPVQSSNYLSLSQSTSLEASTTSVVPSTPAAVATTTASNNKPPTLEELENTFDEMTIEDLEVNNPLWVHRFARARAQYFMKAMKELKDEKMNKKYEGEQQQEAKQVQAQLLLQQQKSSQALLQQSSAEAK